MKIQIISLLLLLLCSTGCSDFLKEASQDEVRPSTVDELESLLLGDVYPKYPEQYLFTDVLTDDIQCNGVSVVYGSPSTFAGILEKEREIFCWSWDPLMMTSFNLWEDYYKKIMGCNVVMDELSEVSGTPERKAFLRGQCLSLRSFYYLLLVNYFGLPYNYGDPEQNPGVPLKLDSGVRDEYFTRASVAAVYKQIEKDLLEADQLLTENTHTVSVYEITLPATKALLSRVYLYMEEWDKSIEFSNQLLQAKPALSAYINFTSLGGKSQGAMYSGVCDPKESKEIIWLYRGAPNLGSVNDYSFLLTRPPYAASDDLIKSYEDTNDAKDLRKKSFITFSNLFGTYSGPLIMNRAKDEHQMGLRTAEVYLNRAEAYIRKFGETQDDESRVKALADLNTLREHRYDTRLAAYVPKSYTAFDDLLNFCKEERRRELCFEEYHRWFDLRRYGMPGLKHEFISFAGIKQEFVLQPESPRYVLPIPQSAMDANPALTQNPQ